MDNATTKKVLDKISPSFCIAKWARTNVRTYEGTSYSCHHCRPIITPKENVVNDHETLTNNDKVKDYKKLTNCFDKYDGKEISSVKRNDLILSVIRENFN